MDRQYFNRQKAEDLLPDHSDIIPAEHSVFNPSHQEIIDTNLSVEEEKWGSRKTARELLEAARKKQSKEKYIERKREQAEQGLAQTKSAAQAVRAAKYEQSKALTPDTIEMQERAGTSAQVSKLLRSLNINLSMQFSKKETYDIIATLLTCNEAQLEALQTNRRVPIVIKTIIKNILLDYERGSMTTVDKLWTRLFGSDFNDNSKNQGGSTTVNILSMVPGVDGSKPISREGYLQIKNHVFGEDD